MDKLLLFDQLTRGCVRARAFFLLLLPTLVFVGLQADISNQDVDLQRPWLTVFVHGIKSIKPHLALNNFFYFKNDTVEDTVYFKTIELMRKDPFFYKNQAIREVGLQQISPRNEEKGDAAGAIAFLFEEVNMLTGGANPNYYYTYGWSGLMSPSWRQNDAIHFFATLEQELSQYHARNIYPKVRVIGYSHGGNVCLNLAYARQEHFPQSKLKIDQLVLLGTPLQCTTDYLVGDSLFKKVYHFYSRNDYVQKLDIFSPRRYFSGRRFWERKDFKLPENLIQVQLKVVRETPKTRQNKRKQQLAKDLTNKTIISGKSHLLRDVSPGHIELWFFGWTPSNYRKSYPLYPLPTVIFAPMIMDVLDEIEATDHLPRSVVVDLRPDHELMLVRQRHAAQVHKVVPFVSCEQLDRLKSSVINFVPDSYTKQEYKQHIGLAHEHARLEYAEEHKKQNPLAAKNQVKCQKKREERKRRQQRRSRRKCEEINVVLHRRLDCPVCCCTI